MYSIKYVRAQLEVSVDFSSSVLAICESPPTYGILMEYSSLVFKAQRMQDSLPCLSVCHSSAHKLNKTAGLSQNAKKLHYYLSLQKL